MTSSPLHARVVCELEPFVDHYRKRPGKPLSAIGKQVPNWIVRGRFHLSCRHSVPGVTACKYTSHHERRVLMYFDVEPVVTYNCIRHET
jgi:hypothetical protein